MDEVWICIRNWCMQRNGWVRLPFVIFFGYVFIRQLGDPYYQSILKPLNLGLHEFGHLMFTPLGEFWHMLGGTIFQLLAPFLGMINFYVQRDFFSITLCFGWLSTSCYDVAVYAGDARQMALPLVSPGGGHTRHDWNYLLGKWEMIQHDQLIMKGFLFLGAASMVTCLILSSGLVIMMIVLSPPDELVPMD